MMTDFSFVRQSLRSRRYSAGVTVLSVAVAAGLLLTLAQLREAGRRAFERGPGTMHLLVSRDASPLVSVLNGIFLAGAPARALTWPQYRELIETFPHEFAIPVQLGDSYRGHPVLATTHDFFKRFQPGPQIPWELKAGKFFEQPFEVVLGARAARDTGLAVGDRILLDHGLRTPNATADGTHAGFEFEVVGVLSQTGGPQDRALFTTLQASWIVHAHERRKRALLSEGGSLSELSPTTEGEVDEVDRKITSIYWRLPTREGAEQSALLPQVYGALRARGDVTVAAPEQEIAQLWEIVGHVDRVLLALAVAVLLSSTVSILLSLYHSMAQRRRQLAVLRVLGCSGLRLCAMVLTESALLGLCGALLGTAFAAAGSWLASNALRERLGLAVEATLFDSSTLLVISGTVLLALFAGLAPALAAYRTPVVKQLHPLG
ncbi:MAG: hypothetical protein AMXMBFR7_22360 [Planctomycetota bacterium]